MFLKSNFYRQVLVRFVVVLNQIVAKEQYLKTPKQTIIIKTVIQQSTNQTFKDDVKEGIVLADFWAEWCGPYRILHPILDEISSERDDVKIISVNIDKSPELAVKFGV